ncbi:MAG: chemotaxis protein CheW [Anaerolineae bacterium]|nr:chemotaxis protein CheW [Anaerolineae bacterium]
MLDYQSSFQYLPVDVSGQVFAIPMSEVAAIRRLSDEEEASSASGESAQSTIPAIDLRSLFFPTPPGDVEKAAYVIVISVSQFACAALVDGVRPARRAEMTEQFTMPSLLSGERYPFKGIIRTPEGLLLIIDTYRLAEALRRARPELIVEKAHGSQR